MNSIKKISKTLIAVDPSLTSTGLASFNLDTNFFIKGLHTIKTRKPSKGEPDERLEQIALSFERQLCGYTYPAILAIETQYIYGSFGNSILKVAEVVGIIKGVYISWMSKRGLEYQIVNISPTEAKKAIGVKGKHKRAESKKLVMECAAKYTGMTIRTQDIADAIAIGIAAKNRLKS